MADYVWTIYGYICFAPEELLGKRLYIYTFSHFSFLSIFYLYEPRTIKPKTFDYSVVFMIQYMAQ